MSRPKYLRGASTQISIFDKSFRYLATSVWIPAVLFGLLALAIWVLMKHTVVGRHLYALGGNEQAARFSGIRTERLKWLAYCISALCASLAGILYIGDQAVAAPQTLGRGYELNAIAAAVVGGCSLQGGVGTVPGTVLGCLFLRSVIDGIAKMIKTGADVYEGLIVGIVVVVAVAFSQLREAGRQGKQFFPGPLGWVAIVTLGLLAATLTTLVADKPGRRGRRRRGARPAGCSSSSGSGRSVVRLERRRLRYAFRLRDPLIRTVMSTRSADLDPARHQALCRRDGVGRCLARYSAGRTARHRRRKRRRQEHADENPLGRDHRFRGNLPAARPRSPLSRHARCRTGRREHHPPGTEPRRAAFGRRQYLSRPRAARPVRAARPAGHGSRRRRTARPARMPHRSARSRSARCGSAISN